MPTEREIRLTNIIVLDVAVRHNEVGGEEASKGNNSPFYVSTVTGKGDKQAKDVPVSKWYRNRPKYYRILRKKLSLPQNRISKERSKKETNKKVGHVIVIVM